MSADRPREFGREFISAMGWGAEENEAQRALSVKLEGLGICVAEERREICYDGQGCPVLMVVATHRLTRGVTVRMFFGRYKQVILREPVTRLEMGECRVWLKDLGYDARQVLPVLIHSFTRDSIVVEISALVGPKKVGHAD